MANEPDQTRLAGADKLHVEAIDAGDDTPRGRELRAQAAKLRIEALGQRSYPVLVCERCLQLTGWTSSEGLCDPCLRHAQTQAAYSDPHGGFVNLNETRRPYESPPGGHSKPGAIARILGGRAGRERARAVTWLTRVDPDRTGPIDPEAGYEVEVAHRDQIDAVDRSGLLVQFRTATHRFDEDEWVELGTTKARRDQLVFPTEQSAALPAEQLVEAWLDYRAAVEAFNCARWTDQSAERERNREAAAAREQALTEQQHAAELLDES